MNVQAIMRQFTNPALWIGGLGRFVVYRMLEVRNIVGLSDLIQPGTNG